MLLYHFFVFLIIAVCEGSSSHGKSFDDQLNGRLQNVFSAIGKVFRLEPEVAMSSSAMIKYYGYPVEVHDIKTEDGYILTNYRIPHGRNGRPADLSKSPVLLIHGSYTSSDMWVANLPEKSLAFLLADAGFDVWMLNCRGNLHSRKHVTLKTSDAAFWDFSIDELVLYDGTALVDYIINITGKNQVYLVGHSLGASMSLMLAADRPEYNSKIKKIYALSPGSFSVGTKGPAQIFQNDYLLKLLKTIGFHEILSTRLIPRQLIGAFVKYFEPLVKYILFSFVGTNSPDSWNATRTPVNAGKGLGSFPVNFLLHVRQIHKSQRLVHFDWGQKKNLDKYGQIYPPDYDLSNVVATTRLFVTTNDRLIPIKDVVFLKNNVRGSVTMSIAGHDWNHISYLWATDAGYFFNTVIRDMNSDSFDFY